MKQRQHRKRLKLRTFSLSAFIKGDGAGSFKRLVREVRLMSPPKLSHREFWRHLVGRHSIREPIVVDLPCCVELPC